MSQLHRGSAAGPSRSTRDRAGCETFGLVRGIGVDGDAGGSGVPALDESEEDSTGFREAAPGIEGVGATGTGCGVDGFEGSLLLGRQGTARG